MRRASPTGKSACMAKSAETTTRNGDANTHDATYGIAADRLRSLVERIERLEEERRALAADIRDVYTEAKSAGFDVKVIRQLIRLRRQDLAEVQQQQNLLDLYRRALDMP